MENFSIRLSLSFYVCTAGVSSVNNEELSLSRVQHQIRIFETLPNSIKVLTRWFCLSHISCSIYLESTNTRYIHFVHIHHSNGILQSVPRNIYMYIYIYIAMRRKILSLIISIQQLLYTCRTYKTITSELNLNIQRIIAYRKSTYCN